MIVNSHQDIHQHKGQMIVNSHQDTQQHKGQMIVNSHQDTQQHKGQMNVNSYQILNNTWGLTQQTWFINPLLVQCWSTVYVAGPTLDQCRVDVPCLLGITSSTSHYILTLSR